MNIEQLIECFKWMSIINIGILLFSTFAVLTMKSLVLRMHSKLFGITEAKVSELVYAYLGMFKVLIIVFNIVPFIALKILY